MSLGSNNPFPSVLVTEQSSAPANPASGKQRVYIRTSDHHLVRVNSSGTVTDIEGTAAGDVVGPGSAVNNQIAVFDSTTGKLIKDGGQTIAQVISAASGSAAAGGSDKDVQYNNSGALGGISPSTAGKVLTSNGASTPSFQFGGLTFIEEKTPTGVGTVTFSSLGSFRHLKLVWAIRGATSATSTGINIQFNGDTAANYDTQLYSSFSTTVGGFQALAATSGGPGNVSAATAPAGAAGVGEMMIVDYAGTTFQKNALSVTSHKTTTSSGGFIQQTSVIDWRNTAAITSVTVFLTAGNYDTGSKLALYGVA